MATTNQPTWELVSNMSDADPLIYGGYFVYRDTTGVYPAEAEWLEPPDDDTDMDSPRARWTVYRFPLEPCTYVDGVLSDNAFHPECAAWFADDIDAIQSAFDGGDVDIIGDLTSSDPVRLAFAYREIGQHHGFVNLDQYPIQLTRDEVNARYPDYSIGAAVSYED